jgi:AcrR family transcriptional regulator
MRDESKRTAILEVSKALFSKQGFSNTSISDIVRGTGFPVGTIYTYFKNKEEIVTVIVEEGWEDLRQRLQETISGEDPAEVKLKAIIENFLPELMEDVDLINILFFEAAAYTGIEEKLENLTTLISKLLKELQNRKGLRKPLPRKMTETALLIYFLGILNTVKLAKTTPLKISIQDIIRFVSNSAESALDIKL